jgi:hypothetical protein
VLEEFRNEEPGSTADVENRLAGLRAERMVDQFAAADDIAGAVAGVELLGDVLVEGQLALGRRLPGELGCRHARSSFQPVFQPVFQTSCENLKGGGRSSKLR